MFGSLSIVLLFVAISPLKSNAESAPIRINCGAENDVVINGITWEADRNYIANQDITRSVSATFNTNQELHEVERNYWWPGFWYNFDLDVAGTYEINLYFSENSVNAIGDRLFDIVINNNLVYSLLDIFNEAGGKYIELIKTFEVTIDSNNLNLEIYFQRLSGGNLRAKCNAIEIINIVASPTVPTTTTTASPVVAPIPSPNPTPNPTPSPTPSPTPTSMYSSNTWYTKQTFPLNLGEISAMSVDDSGYYVFGGQTSSGSWNSKMYKYNIATNTWTQLNDVASYARGHHQTSQTYNGKIYTFGGSQSSYSYYMRVYDPDSDSWTLLAALKVSGTNYDLLSPSSGIIGNKIYVAGGIRGSSNTVNTVFEYDISSNTWTQKASMPAGRNHAAGIGYNGLFYVFGGRTGGNTPGWGYDTSFVYDPNSDTWDEVATMLSGTGGNGQAVEMGGKLLVMGGETCCDALGKVHAYDPVTDTWEYLSDMITPRHGIAPVAVENGVYVACGGTDSGFGSSNVHEVLLFS